MRRRRGRPWRRFRADCSWAGRERGNAKAWLEAGASHVIVTSWVFRDGRLDGDRLRELVRWWAATGWS
jgi:hypothetical protein